MTGLMILGGLIAFVIPGVILSIRYALVDAVVVIEDEGTSGARARSAELTVGRRWRILGASILFFLVFVMSSTVVQLPLNFIEPLNTMPFIVVQDCLIDIASALIQIVMFVFYWEATQDESHSEDGAAPNGGPIEQSWDPRVTEGWPGVDDNPYRAPVSG